MYWSDLILDQNHPKKPYRQRKDNEKHGIYRGQRKLLLAELAFFIRYATVPCIVVYAGAGPGHHLLTLIGKISWVKEWHLYDPVPLVSKLKGMGNVHVYQQLFTKETAAQWADKDVVFISDIRTANHRVMDTEENEKAVLDDMSLQRELYEIIQPRAALLKFRLPYSYEGVGETYSYLDGMLMKQPYAPLSSSECRLVVLDLKAKTKVYNIKDYEDAMFYHNDELRKNNYDQKMEEFIWKEYDKIR